ncbi:cellulase family glycosylhydrolase [Phytohabitans flavus]|uniref:Beta-xylosidase n=1 Tax=Phytohabitans flavus TaxID=1076124 RepID=A0A6F8XY53_9ACTN|nr:xylan 1,4-beta-xylosidase [Phytohabitans flavus]BCB78755.1 beta-xylosidase [Phytohabitans flavus]
MTSVEEQARAGWARLMGSGGAQDRAPGQIVPADLPAPNGLVATGGRGHVTLSWEPVPGAIGYAVHRATASSGPYEPVDHGGGDVLAVPHGPYADTTGEPFRQYWYAVAPLSTVTSMGPLSVPAVAAASAGAADGLAEVAVHVAADVDAGPLHRPWRAMVGSEHLSHLLCEDTTGGRPIGAELTEALRRVRDELGVQQVRAHAILCDDLGVYKVVDGRPRLDFSGVDRVYDTVLELGMRPVVELSFMPRDLASDPSRTVFAYEGIISPPRDWEQWSWLVRELTAHLVERYGLDEIRDNWWFEVWNEANLSVFWSGTPEEFWRLYDETARAVKAVDPGLRVGGPASAAVGWIDDQLARTSPVDFVSTHTYGSPPLDLRPLAGDRPLLWTEWGVTATHGSEVNDTVFAAAFLLRGMRSTSRRVDALAPWVASDHFEELGRPPRLTHGGFGLLTVGNLAKPKYWALTLAQRLGDTELPVALSGDGAAGLVEAWAARSGDGTVTVLLWNATLDHAKADGDPELDRAVTVDVTGLPSAAYRLTHWRVDATHSNIAALWRTISEGRDWPDERQWAALREADRLAEVEPSRVLEARNGTTALAFDLPMPAISCMELVPMP